jgi:acetylglutamate kinase
MEKLYVIKIGGNIIDDEGLLDSFLKKFALLQSAKILIHGGGKLATRMAEKMGIPQKMVDGRRITDLETLKIVTMVYAGYINKNLVARLQSLQCNVLGICGADANSILSHKRTGTELDYGFAGDVDYVNEVWFSKMLHDGLALVVAPITHDGKSQLLNTNADTVAQEIAKTLGSFYEVTLIYGFEKAGVLLDLENEQSVIKKLDLNYYGQLKQSEKIFAGMIPKLDNAFAAIGQGVQRVIIGKAEELEMLITGETGTTITHE